MATHREALLSESDTEYERKMNKATQKKVFTKIFKKIQIFNGPSRVVWTTPASWTHH